MNIFSRTVMKIVLATLFFGGVGFGLYIAYDYAVENAIKRVRASVANGIFDVVNPLKWPRRIFGSRS
jgi:hypothetical protein